MTIITGGRKAIVKKMSPRGHLVLAWKPKKYPKTAQQTKVRNAAIKCGIKKGISKSALQTAMRCCIPKEFGKAIPDNCT